MGDAAGEPEGQRPLSSLKPGVRALVKGIDGGRFMVQRMGMLGIRRGVEVRIVHGPGLRGAVVQVGAARIALGRALIDCVRVEPKAVPAPLAERGGEG